jgi:ABC-type glycerol-3-phosphate transport system substrate-binding protein
MNMKCFSALSIAAMLTLMACSSESKKEETKEGVNITTKDGNANININTSDTNGNIKVEADGKKVDINTGDVKINTTTEGDDKDDDKADVKIGTNGVDVKTGKGEDVKIDGKEGGVKVKTGNTEIKIDKNGIKAPGVTIGH